MIIRFGVLAVLAAAAAQSGPGPLQTRGGNSAMLVTTDWLASHLKDESLVILHVGSRKDYDAGHIPGARLVTLADVSITDARGLSLEMPPVNVLEEALGRLGVTDASRVVVYPGTSSVQAATRVWFTLDYVGLGQRASLLDGGLAAWRAEGRPLGTAAPPVEPGAFAAHPAAELIVTAEWVRAHLDDPKVQLLDARAPEFYSGANAGSMPRAGHIPGARNVPFTSVLDGQGKLKPAPVLREIMDLPGGQEPALTVSYCHIGQQATVLYFVARYLGLPVRLYDGSFQEWSGRRELPVEPAPR
jgi:thiosulfate/3-mercaptopyruvate sulfurtransferase